MELLSLLPCPAGSHLALLRYLLGRPTTGQCEFELYQTKITSQYKSNHFSKNCYFAISPCIKRDYHSRKGRLMARGRREMSYKQCKAVLIRVKNWQSTILNPQLPYRTGAFYACVPLAGFCVVSHGVEDCAVEIAGSVFVAADID